MNSTINWVIIRIDSGYKLITLTIDELKKVMLLTGPSNLFLSNIYIHKNE